MSKRIKPSKSLSKEHYEIEKLKAEIAEIKLPSYKKIPFWNFIATTLIAIGTVTLLFINGAFDFKTKALELKRENLEYDVRQFTNDKINLKNQIEVYKIELTKLINAKDELQTAKNKLEYAYKVSNGSLSKKDKYLANLLVEYNALTDKYNEVSRQKNPTELYSWLKSYQPNTLSDLGKSISENNNSPSFAVSNTLSTYDLSSLNTYLGRNVNSILNPDSLFIEKNYFKSEEKTIPTSENKIDFLKYNNVIQRDSNGFIKLINNN